MWQIEKPDILASDEEFLDSFYEKSTKTCWVKYKNKYGDVLVRKTKEYYCSPSEQECIHGFASSLSKILPKIFPPITITTYSVYSKTKI
jgi:hypothetical protein